MLLVKNPKITKHDKKIVKTLVDHYKSRLEVLTIFQGQLNAILNGNGELKKHIHSIKTRLKDPKHLEKKLFRKILDCKREGKKFEIDIDNMFLKINDLVGFRILHLYSKQIEFIDEIIRNIIKEKKFGLLEKPSARTWDDEFRTYFKKLKIKTLTSESMYTSVHYILRNNESTTLTAEIQVRTLAEELWGEVDHSINYPVKSKKESCKEQIRVLARLTSSCTRLVDSIFKSR